MRIVAWSIGIDLVESILIGIGKNIYLHDNLTEVEYGIHLLCVKFSISLIYE